jgi:hypothetical protein
MSATSAGRETVMEGSLTLGKSDVPVIFTPLPDGQHDPDQTNREAKQVAR